LEDSAADETAAELNNRNVAKSIPLEKRNVWFIIIVVVVIVVVIVVIILVINIV